MCCTNQLIRGILCYGGFYGNFQFRVCWVMRGGEERRGERWKVCWGVGRDEGRCGKARMGVEGGEGR